MEYTTQNLTEISRSENPQEGDRIQYTYNNGTVRVKIFHVDIPMSQEEIEDQAKQWRNAELQNHDYIVPLTDHPDHTATLAYRVALRDWPSTSDFPETKPTL